MSTDYTKNEERLAALTTMQYDVTQHSACGATGWTVNIEQGTYADGANTSAGDITLSPGASPGCVTMVGNMVLGVNDALLMDINGLTACTQHDQFNVTGTVTLGGANLLLNIGGGYVPANGDQIILIDNDGADPVDGQFAQGSTITVSGYTFAINYHGGDGNDVVLTSCGTGVVHNTTLGRNYCKIQDAINDAAAGNTITVDAGTYNENITVDRPLTITGINAGIACPGTRVAESTINGGAGTAVTIASTGVTIDGFAISGSVGIADNAFAGLSAVNNSITAGLTGIAITNLALTPSSGLTVRNNCVNMTAQVNGGNPTIGINLYVVSGSAAAVISGNTLTNGGYGYSVYDLVTSPMTTITGGSVDGFINGVMAANTNGSAWAPSTFGLSTIPFTGQVSTFQSGIYVVTTGSTATDKITAFIDHVTVTGTGNGASDWAGMRFGDWSTGTGARQDIHITASNLINNLNRGIHVRGGNVLADIGTSTLTGNGSAAAAGQDGFGIWTGNNANVTVHNNFITNPATSTSKVDALSTAFGGVMTANENSLDPNGNATSKLAFNASGTLSATCNWWSSACSNIFTPYIQGVVSYNPWLVGGGDGPGTGFQPTATCVDTDPVITGPADVCFGSTGNVYTVAVPTGETWTGFTWLVSGGQITSGGGPNDHTVTVSWIYTGGTNTVTVFHTTYGCSSPLYVFNVNVKPLPTATIGYAGNPYCATGTATVSLTGPLGGTYSSTAGLVIDPSSGDINLAASATGSYTVTYSFTGVNGCSNTTTTGVTINPLPSITTAAAATNVCHSAASQFTTLGYSAVTFAPTTYSIAWNASPTNSFVPVTNASLPVSPITIAVPALTDAGTYTGTITVKNANGCTSTGTTFTITVNPLPMASISYPGNPFCARGVAVVSQSGQTGGTYSSTPGLVINASTGQVDLVASTPGDYTVTYSFTDGNGCSSTTTTPTPITIHALPVATILYAGSPYCATGTANVTQTGQGGGTYSSTPGLSINPATGAVDLGASTPGIYTVTYTFSSSPGAAPGGISQCTSTTTASITVNPLPLAYTVTGGGSYCAGGTGVAIGLNSSDLGVNYQLYLGVTPVGIPVPGTGNPITFGLHTAAGTYTVQGTFATTTCNNTMLGFALVSINPLPTASISYPGDPYCARGTASVTQTGQAGGTYTSTTGLVINASTGLVDLVASTAGNYTVTYSFSDGNGCSNTTTTGITIHALPVATISYAANPYCATGTASVTQTGTGGGTYSASPSGLSINSGNGQVNLAASTPGIYTVTYSFNGPGPVGPATGGCSNTTTTSITVNALPTLYSVTGGGAYCAGGTGVAVGLNSTDVGVNYQLFNGLVPVGSPVPGTGNPIPFGLQTAAGTYTVQATNATTTCTSTMTGSAIVEINPLPAAFNVTGGGTYCTGGTGVPVGLDGSAEGFTYQLYLGVTPVGSPLNGSGFVLDFGLQTLAGTYTIQATDMNTGCQKMMTGSAVITITPLPAPVISGPAVVNAGATGNVYTTALHAGYNYSWNISGGTITGGAGTHTITVTWGAGPAGWVQVTESNAQITCTTTTAPYNVTINQFPTVVITGPANACCGTNASTAHYCGVVSGLYVAPLNYQWTVTGGSITYGANTSCIDVSWACCGQGNVYLVVTDANGYLISASMNVAVHPTPSPVITGPSLVAIGQTATYCSPSIIGPAPIWVVTGGSITGGQGTYCITVLWDQCNVCPNGTVSITEYSNGCTGTTTMTVTFLPGTGNLGGYVTYYNNYATGLNGVTVSAYNTTNGTLAGSTITGPNTQGSYEPGYYSFNLAPGNYHIVAGYNGTWGGNNATDALLVQLNVISAYPLAYINWKSADVNGSQNLTGLDALYIKLRTIGSINTYPAGDWVFSDSTVNLASPAAVNIKGLCVGDVNGSFIPTGFKEASFLQSVSDNVETVPVGQPFTYTLSSSSAAELGAMTLFMNYDTRRFDVLDVLNAPADMKYKIEDGHVALAWSDTKALSVSALEPIIRFSVKAKQPVSQPTDLFTLATGGEFADALATRYDNFSLSMPKVMTESVSSECYLMNYPNPFRNTTDIIYSIPEASDVKLVLTNMYGEVLRTLTDARQQAGAYRITIDPAEYHMAPGTYLYQIVVNGSTTNFNKVNKMVLTK